MPSPSNALSYHVAGPQILQANIGPLAAFVNIGVCEDGVDIELRVFTHDVKFDGAGGPEGDAGEVIFLNATAMVRCTLVPFSGNYINSLRAYSQTAATNGTMRQPGRLFGTNGNLLTVKFTSNDIDGGWQFTYCQVVRAGSNKASVVETKPVWEFRAINFVDPGSATDITDSVLYSRV